MFRIAAAVLLGIAAAAQRVSAQEGAVVAASVGVTAIESRTELTFAGAGGYRFNRYVGFEIEATAVPTLKAAFPNAAPTPLVVQAGTAGAPTGAAVVGGFVVPGPTYSNVNGDATIVTTDMRVELPMPSGPVTPFFVAGGGVAALRHSADLTLPIGIAQPFAAGSAIAAPTIRTTTEHLTSASTALALTIGGGVSVRLASRASVDGDLRFFRMMDVASTNAGRFAVGVRYRF